MLRFFALLVLVSTLLVGCHEKDMVFHLITPPATGEVDLVPTVTPTPEETVLPDGPVPTLEPQVLPEDYPVKGNISRSGEKIYHVPGQANYDRVVIDPEMGERYFATEEEAVAAGWRKAQR